MFKISLKKITSAALFAFLFIALVACNPGEEFKINTIMNPGSNLKLQLNQSFLVEIGVTDTDPSEDSEPWTLCGIIAREPNPADWDFYAYDHFLALSPSSAEVAIVQDQSNLAYDFPPGGMTEVQKNFACDIEGKDEVYFHYMTSRLVSDCSSESLIKMQNDPNVDRKSVKLGDVECFVEIVEPPEEAGVIHSPSVESVETETGGGDSEVPEGFCKVVPVPIEIDEENVQPGQALVEYVCE